MYKYRAELAEMFLEGVGKCYFGVSRSQQVKAEDGAIVKQAPLKVPLKDRLGTIVPTGELDSRHGPSCLEPWLVPEQGH